MFFSVSPSRELFVFLPSSCKVELGDILYTGDKNNNIFNSINNLLGGGGVIEVNVLYTVGHIQIKDKNYAILCVFDVL